MKIPFSPPDITEAEIEEITDTLRSGWITTGPKTKLFEKKIAEFLRINKCVCLNSQTACAEMALRLMGIGPRDEVITTAYTYTATASVISHVGAKTVLVDIRPDSFEMDYDAAERAVTDRTKAIIPVDLGGVPCDYHRIFELVNRKKDMFVPSSPMQQKLGRIAVLADAAHAFGAEFRGVKIGNIADFSSFSFHAVKNLTTAEGGCLAWHLPEAFDDEEIYKQLQLFSLHGQSKDALSKNKLGAWEYDVIGTWYKCNMTDMAAAVGIKQLERYEGMLDRRRKIIEYYDSMLKQLGVETLPHFNGEHTSSGHLYITRIPGISLSERNEIIVKMAEKDIACNVHYKPLPLLTAYKNMGFDIKDFPNAYRHFENEITLPLHTCLTDEMVRYTAENFVRIIKEYI
ncbi:MAG: DegT/DnrJ/EryC1/StrS family aminotransferase [Clostridia bacterium]|nr:DegT/DnrJ/EryC1/StrS family aminotransferase [Clostridia bacterium]